MSAARYGLGRAAWAFPGSGRRVGQRTEQANADGAGASRPEPPAAMVSDDVAESALPTTDTHWARSR